jgi:hypothetical protein
MQVALWADILKVAGAGGVVFAAIASFVWYQNRVFVPKLLDDHRTFSRDQAAAFTAALTEQRTAFMVVLTEQRSDVLAAQKDAKGADNVRCKQQEEMFERRIDAQSASHQKILETQATVTQQSTIAITEELKAMKGALLQITELVIDLLGERHALKETAPPGPGRHGRT